MLKNKQLKSCPTPFPTNPSQQPYNRPPLHHPQNDQTISPAPPEAIFNPMLIPAIAKTKPSHAFELPIILQELLNQQDLIGHGH